MANECYENLRDMSDDELIRLIRGGNENAFSVLMGKYLFTVRSCAVSYNSCGIDFEDLVQEGVIGLMNAVNNYDSAFGASFSTFARLCIDRRIISVVRSSLRKKQVPPSALVFLDNDDENNLNNSLNIFADVNDPESVVIARENLKLLTEKIFSKLSKTEIKVLKLYLGGYSYENIAKILECSVKSVDNAIQRLRRKLK